MDAASLNTSVVPSRDGDPQGSGAPEAALADLVAVVARLRDPEAGCPWDLEQTHASLVPYVLEEAHEVADAIRHGDDRHLAEELGDLLLQVVLHAQIASEEGRFDLATICRGLSAKLVRRHPHVFAGANETGNDPAARPGAEPGHGPGDKATGANRGRSGDSAAVTRSWEAIKAAERSGDSGSGQALAPSSSPLSDQLASKVRGQPSLASAMTISRKAAAAGFEWDGIEGVWEKVVEELGELQEAVASGNQAHAQEELGDVMFTLVNVARWCGLDPEAGLAGTNRRFLNRFSRVEAALGGDLQGRGITELEALWRQAKAEIREELAAQDAAALRRPDGR
ncbi:MAG: nucleoside triphosphate pyrophosphohydrolase [Cyanobacteria bacterium]|nr:nucleoside triphosphate pyrophosphohydrolase [Cyanobacteriota bacterium]